MNSFDTILVLCNVGLTREADIFAVLDGAVKTKLVTEAEARQISGVVGVEWELGR